MDELYEAEKRRSTLILRIIFCEILGRGHLVFDNLNRIPFCVEKMQFN